MHFPISIFRTQSEMYNVTICEFSRIKKNIEKAFSYPIICINKGDPLTTYIIKPHIPRRAYTSIFFMKHTDTYITAVVALRVFVANLTTPVRAPVVYQQYLEVPERLRQDTVHAFPEVLLRFKYRYYH